jgi:hypothetical protein
VFLPQVGLVLEKVAAVGFGLKVHVEIMKLLAPSAIKVHLSLD